MAQRPELIPHLKQIPLFRRIDEASLLLLTEHLTLRDYADGETIFAERDPGQSVYAIETGSVVVSKVIDWDDMTEKTLAILPRGAFFGEGGLIDSEARSANIRARGPTRVIELDRTGFLHMLQAAPLSAIQVLFGITRIINARLRQTSHELVTLFDTGKLAGSGLKLEVLLAKIVERAVESTSSTQGAVFLVNPYTQELELGHAFGIAPEGPFDLAQGLFAHVVGENRALVSNDLSATGIEARGWEPRSLVACAIRHDDAPTGMLLIGGREGGAAYTGGHLHLLQGIALQVGAAIENARRKAEEEAEEAHHRHYVTF